MKFFNILVITVGIIILLNAGGITTASGGLVKGLLNGGLANFKSNQLWTTLVGILTLSLLTGAAASLFGRSPDPSWVLASLASLFGGIFLTDIITIYSKLYNTGEVWIQWVAGAIFIPMVLVFFMSLISWWRGTEA